MTSKFLGIRILSLTKEFECDYDEYALDGFTDAYKVSSYARVPMQWAVYMGILNGTSSTMLSPRLGAQRCQAAVLIYRFIFNMMMS